MAQCRSSLNVRKAISADILHFLARVLAVQAQKTGDGRRPWSRTWCCLSTRTTCGHGFSRLRRPTHEPVASAWWERRSAAAGHAAAST